MVQGRSNLEPDRRVSVDVGVQRNSEKFMVSEQENEEARRDASKRPGITRVARRHHRDRRTKEAPRQSRGALEMTLARSRITARAWNRVAET